MYGQTEVFIISLLMAAYLSYARGNTFLAALLLAGATLLKVTPAFLLIYFVLYKRDVRFLLIYGGAILGLVLLSLLLIPFKLYPDYVVNVLPAISQGKDFWVNQSITKYFVFSPSLLRAISVGGMVVIATIIWLFGKRAAGTHSIPMLPLGAENFLGELVFMLNLLGILIFVMIIWPAAYVWLIPVSAWLLTGLVHWRVKPTYLVLITFSVFLVTAKTYGYPFLNSMNLWGGLLMSSLLIVGLLKRDKVFPEPALVE